MNIRGILWFIPILGHWLAWTDLTKKYGAQLDLSRRYLYLVRLENLVLYFMLGVVGGYMVSIGLIGLAEWLRLLLFVWLTVGSLEILLMRRFGDRMPRFLGWWRAKLLLRKDFALGAITALYHALVSLILGTFVTILLV